MRGIHSKRNHTAPVRHIMFSQHDPQTGGFERASALVVLAWVKPEQRELSRFTSEPGLLTWNREQAKFSRPSQPI